VKSTHCRRNWLQNILNLIPAASRQLAFEFPGISAHDAGIGPGAQPSDTRNTYRRGVQRITRALMDTEVPAIGAVNGHAVWLGANQNWPACAFPAMTCQC
jgi:hypothetical protein